MFRRKLVAVVVPVSKRAEFVAEELVSLRHLLHHLGRYDKYLVAPAGNPIQYEGFQVKSFPRKYFGSVAAHTRMMLSEHFYRTFQEYQFILIYHLDALVLSDQLEAWCGEDYDFIGPPWIRCDSTPWVSVEGVGNGGFSLRKVESFLRVLRSNRYRVDPEEYWRRVPERCTSLQRSARLPKRYWKKLRLFNGVRWHIRHYIKHQRNEDRFWAREARRYVPDFRIAPVDVALRFAFEGDPRRCYQRTHRRLPFGCHAWQRYDREFWEPYLLP